MIWDRDAGEIVELQDGDPVPLPTDPGRYDAAGTAPHRELAELRILQPDGPGFTVDDGQLRWGPWQLRVSLHPVEGLVLHEVTYIEGDRARPILFRASMSEMVVPYGSTAMNHWWKNAFDAGECGLGLCASSLELGCDCLGEIVYLDGVQVDDEGTATPLTQRHLPARGGLRHPLEARRRAEPGERDPPVAADGGLLDRHRGELRVRLLLVLLPRRHDPGRGEADRDHPDAGGRARGAGAVREPGDARAGRAASPARVQLPARLRLDGPANSVYEVDAVPVPTGPDNPYGNAFTAQATLLETELQAQRMAAAEKARYWKIVNHGVTNAVGEPVAYKLVPAHATRPAAGPAGRRRSPPGPRSAPGTCG